MKADVLRFLREGGDFGAAAMALYRWQRARNPVYDAFCGALRPTRWEDIPAVPVGLFRDAAFTCFPLGEATTVFRTSGTTAGRRGEHWLRDPAVADLSARLHADATVGPIPASGVGLVPTAPDSSLGHMCRLLAPGLASFFSADGGVDVAGALAALRAAAEPVFVPGTAFALAELVEADPGPVALPAGSVVMVTGGYKGRARAVAERDLLVALAGMFPGARLVGEYGMTELSSQLWSARAGDPFTPPPWLRVRAVDPVTERPAREGVLRYLDLANHESVLAIETEDVGEVLPDGRVALAGRLTGAAPRGCSCGGATLRSWPPSCRPPTPGLASTSPSAPSRPTDSSRS